MDARENTPGELAALELYHQLANLSPDDGDRTLMVTLRMPNGRYVGDVWLSMRDVQDLADASVGLAAVRDHQEAVDTDAPLLGEPLLDVDDTDVADLISEVEAHLNGGTL